MSHLTTLLCPEPTTRRTMVLSTQSCLSNRTPVGGPPKKRSGRRARIRWNFFSFPPWSRFGEFVNHFDAHDFQVMNKRIRNHLTPSQNNGSILILILQHRRRSHFVCSMLVCWWFSPCLPTFFFLLSVIMEGWPAAPSHVPVGNSVPPKVHQNLSLCSAGVVLLTDLFHCASPIFGSLRVFLNKMRQIY